MKNGAKKSLYIFMTGLLGMLLFLMIDRIIVFFYLFLAAGGLASPDISYGQFLFWDYFAMTIAMLLGGWYGIWLGLYWYKIIYEDQTHRGFVHHLAVNYFPSKQELSMASRMEGVKSKIEQNMLELEELSKPVVIEVREPEPIKRRVVRRAAPKKLTTVSRKKIKTFVDEATVM